jgi:hypothetical protein
VAGRHARLSIVDEWVDPYDRTFEEDKRVVAAQQVGFDSGRVETGHVLGHVEPAIRRFQLRTFDALSDDTDNPMKTTRGNS